MYVLTVICLFFFFKQKTAYEMRISDWSSDVCSSDLKGLAHNSLRMRDGAGAILFLVVGKPMGSRRRSQGPAVPRKSRGCQRNGPAGTFGRSEARSVGNECVSTCSSRWATCL